jgi:hypothetical protein
MKNKEHELQKAEVQLSRELSKLNSLFSKAIDYAESHHGKLNKSHKDILRDACGNFLAMFNCSELALDLVFYDNISLLLEDVTFLRTLLRKEDPNDDELLMLFTEVVAELYTVVYSNPIVQKVCVSTSHIGEKLSQFNTIAATEQLIGTMFHKIVLLEMISEATDKKLEAIALKLDELKNADKDKTEEMSDAQDEFIDITFASYALHTAIDLALEELGVIKNHLRSLLAK